MVEWLLVGGSGQIIAVAGTLEQNRKTVSELFFNLPSFCLFVCGCVLISRMIRQQLFVGPGAGLPMPTRCINLSFSCFFLYDIGNYLISGRPVSSGSEATFSI